MDGGLTKRYYVELEHRGPAGTVALNLFRAQKCSARAKIYKRRSHTQEAYARKQWSMANLCDALERYGEPLGIRYGWKSDPGVVFGGSASFVLYVEIATGQVSFHSPERGRGPDYERAWDQSRANQERILEFCDMVFDREFPTHAEAFQDFQWSMNS
jgi:hypothetical protein